MDQERANLIYQLLFRILKMPPDVLMRSDMAESRTDAAMSIRYDAARNKSGVRSLKHLWHKYAEINGELSIKIRPQMCGFWRQGFSNFEWTSL